MPNLKVFSTRVGFLRSARITNREGITMNRILQNTLCRLLAGNFSIALLVIGIPVAILFKITGTLTTSTAVIAVLAILHVSLLGLQISQRGTWVPEKWLAAGYVFLPVIDVSQTVSWFSNGLYREGFCAFALALTAAFITVSIVKNQWRKWLAPKTVAVTKPSTGREALEQNQSVDDPTMIY